MIPSPTASARICNPRVGEVFVCGTWGTLRVVAVFARRRVPVVHLRGVKAAPGKRGPALNYVSLRLADFRSGLYVRTP